MAVRPSMMDLIGRLRLLISDPADTPSFTDQALQDALDAQRQRVSLLQLDEVASGVFCAPLGDWEDDVALTTSSGTVLTPTEESLIVGEWVIAASSAYLSGKTYDLYAAAADVLEMWAAAVKCKVDIEDGSKVMKLSQQFTALMSLAAEYRSQQRVRIITMERNDVWA